MIRCPYCRKEKELECFINSKQKQCKNCLICRTYLLKQYEKRKALAKLTPEEREMEAQVKQYKKVLSDILVAPFNYY